MLKSVNLPVHLDNLHNSFNSINELLFGCNLIFEIIHDIYVRDDVDVLSKYTTYINTLPKYIIDDFTDIVTYSNEISFEDYTYEIGTSLNSLLRRLKHTTHVASTITVRNNLIKVLDRTCESLAILYPNGERQYLIEDLSYYSESLMIESMSNIHIA